MLYNFQRKKLCRHLLVGGALFAAGFGVISCSDTYDLDTEQPSNLNSIYGYMQEQGNFKNYLQLIEDLGQADILSKTGSKTMFIANDDAFAKFFTSNPWGVTKYADLSLAQKKLLLNSAMIDNPYSTSMLSTAEGPVKGEVCRRSSSLSLMDSVLVVTKENSSVLPDNSRFQELIQNHDSIVLFTDASYASPMIHFTPKFLISNKITSEDIDFIYGQPAGTRVSDDVYVNNSKVIDANIFCKNGFIHQVDQVILPLDNMAEIIRKNPNTTIYSSILERFAIPVDSVSLTSTYNNNKGTNIDTVFVKRYFSDRSDRSTPTRDVAVTVDKNGQPFDASLRFDPGWNGLIPAVSNSRDGMMEDMAVMLVPTDDAIRDWWENGGGKVIKNYYKTIEATPNSTLDDLIRVNQLVSFTQAVPSKFGDILNDANEKMGVSADSIVGVDLACNGVIYYTKNVYAPTSYSSVLFPTVVDTTQFKVIENAIDNLKYGSYLNSMVSNYIFLLPTNEALKTYIDPVSFGQVNTLTGENNFQLWNFGFDETKKKEQRIYADIYSTNLVDGVWVPGEKITTGNSHSIQNQDVSKTSTVIGNRYEELLDNIIIVEPFQAGKKYYRTKGNNFIRVDGIEEGSTIYGSMSASDGAAPQKVLQSYSMKNGKTLVVDGVVQTTSKSVAKIIAEHDEFSEFFTLLNLSGALNKVDSKDGWQAGDQVYGNLYNEKEAGKVGAEDANSKKATYLLNNYHYTIYAPTNAAIKKAREEQKYEIPTTEDYLAAVAYDDVYDELSDAEKDDLKRRGCCEGDSAARVMEAILDFVKYHIQDNSIYADQGFKGGAYESAKTELVRSTDIAEEGTYTASSDKKKVTIDGKTYEVKTWMTDGSGQVEYYTGKYSPGRPYKLQVNFTSSDNFTVTDVMGNVCHIDPTLRNLQAREYWYKSTGSLSTAAVRSAMLNNSSSAVVHGIDGVLVYDPATQFHYKYKAVTSNGAPVRK